MMKNPKNLLVFAVLGGIVGLGLGFIGGRVTAPNPAKITVSEGDKLAMSAVLEAQQDAWNTGDIEGFMQGYDKSEQLRFASGGDITFGWQDTLTRYQARYTSRAQMGTIQFDIQNVEVINGDNGMIFGKWTLTREADTPNGLFTLFMKKTPDGWKIASDHTSSAK